MPTRTRRSRAAGSKMTGRYVGRTPAHPRDYGNPWAVREWKPTGPTPLDQPPGQVRARPGRRHRWTIEGPGIPLGSVLFADRADAHRFAVTKYRRALVTGQLPYTLADVRRELRGLDLACYCGPEFACHVDVLIEAANTDFMVA